MILKNVNFMQVVVLKYLRAPVPPETPTTT